MCCIEGIYVTKIKFPGFTIFYNPQEQEQEQEIEMEVQKEEARVEAAPAKQDYSREYEALHPFKIQDLAHSPEVSRQGFFPCSQFNIKTWKGTSPTLPFPTFLLMSRNHYNPTWSLKSLRRLKSVIALVEWIPAEEQLEFSSEVRDLSKSAIQELDRVFSMFDLDQVLLNTFQHFLLLVIAFRDSRGCLNMRKHVRSFY
jgi:hypothetical protein